MFTAHQKCYETILIKIFTHLNEHQCQPLSFELFKMTLVQLCKKTFRITTDRCRVQNY